MEKLRVREFDTVQFTRMVRRINLFSAMNMGLLEKILAGVSLYRYRKGEQVCREGTPGDSFFVLYEGRAGVYIGRLFFFSRRIASLGPGDCFGEMSLLAQAPRSATVVCEEDSSVFVLPAEHFAEAVKANPAFATEIKGLALARKEPG